MGILIEQGLNILQNGIGLLAGTAQAERLIAAANRILPHKQKCDEIVENIDTLYRQKELVIKNKIPVIEERLEEEKIKLDEALLLWAVRREIVNQTRQKMVDYLKSRNELELAKEWENKGES